MTTQLKKLEAKLDDIFGKQAPPLPDNVKQFIVKYLPWFNLFVALLSLFSLYNLWYWANRANDAAEFVNELSRAYGIENASVERLTVMVWVGLITLSVQVSLYLLAFQPLRALKKQGWDYLFYAMLVNIAYGVVVLFTDYGNIGSLIGTIIGSAIGFYFLFQIRASYLGSSKKPAKKSASKTAK